MMAQKNGGPFACALLTVIIRPAETKATEFVPGVILPFHYGEPSWPIRSLKQETGLLFPPR
jgi:hypothetical protein